MQNILRSKTPEILRPPRIVDYDLGRHKPFDSLYVRPTDKAFTIVRHPVTWFMSYYTFCLGYHPHAVKGQWEMGRWHPTNCLHAARWKDFDIWMRGVYQMYPSFLTKMYTTMTTPPKGIDPPHVFRLEDNPFKDVLKFMGLPQDIPELPPKARNTAGVNAKAQESTNDLIRRQEKEFIDIYYPEEMI